MKILLPESDIRKVIKGVISEAGFDRKSIGGSGGSAREDEEAGPENYKIDQLKFEQIDLSGAATNASALHEKIGAKGIKDGDESSNKTIVELVHKPIYDSIRGQGAMEKDVKDSGKSTIFDFYVANLNKRAWSSWFLNRCYLNTPAEAYIKSIAKGFSHSGCCYPYAKLASSNRPAVFNEPEANVGKTMLMIFSREEIEASPDLSFKPGVASIVGQGSGDPDWENIRSTTKLQEGDKHMNIMISNGSWIGGNLSSSTGIVNDDKKGGYMLLVKFKGIKKPGMV